MKILNGKELAGFIKERQSHQVASIQKKPKLLIIRDSDNPVITKYVQLKIQYGEDIGVKVEDFRANNKDVDGLGENASFDSATATAILWLLSGYDIKLTNQKIAIVGRGKLVGMPLYKMFTNSNYDVTLFHRGDDLTNLKQYDIIITATGVPGLIVDSMIKPGAILVDAGTASEDGVLKGDLAAEIRKRTDLSAITPTTGGVGPLTVTCLFDHVIQSITNNH